MAGSRTVAFDSYGCEVACKDPDRPNVRYEGSLTFLDGTPCGGGGTCKNVSVVLYSLYIFKLYIKHAY